MDGWVDMNGCMNGYMHVGTWSLVCVDEWGGGSPCLNTYPLNSPSPTAASTTSIHSHRDCSPRRPYTTAVDVDEEEVGGWRVEGLGWSSSERRVWVAGVVEAHSSAVRAEGSWDGVHTTRFDGSNTAHADPGDVCFQGQED